MVASLDGPRKKLEHNSVRFFFRFINALPGYSVVWLRKSHLVPFDSRVLKMSNQIKFSRRPTASYLGFHFNISILSAIFTVVITIVQSGFLYAAAPDFYTLVPFNRFLIHLRHWVIDPYVLCPCLTTRLISFWLSLPISYTFDSLSGKVTI
jgi:hypothetical protein